MKEKEIITVPKGVEFISQWMGFDINSLTFLSPRNE